MPRFFVNKNNIEENKIHIDGSDAHHIARSLRMAEGDEAIVCDGEGTEYRCTLTRIRDEECECEILESREGRTESPLEITLYMGYPKGDKLEVVIQKAVELGASRIIPFESSRCVKRPKDDKIEKQTARLQRLAEEAAKQCGRARLPRVQTPVSFKNAIAEARLSDLPLFCYEGDGTRSLKKVLEEKTNAKACAVVVGCEGGFSIEEAEFAISEGMIPINLGPRILRCETAPTYALS